MEDAHWFWGHMRRRVSAYRRLFFLSACVFGVFGFLAMFSTPAYQAHVSPEAVILLWVFFWLSLGARLALAELCLKKLSATIPSLRRHPKETTFEPAPASEQLAEYYMQQYFESSQGHTLVNSVALLVDPPSFTSRVSQSFRLHNEKYSIDLARTINTNGQALSVPLLKVFKGRIVGSLRVTVDDKRTRTLTFDESKGFQVAALSVTFDRVLPVSQYDDLLNRCCDAVVGATPPSREDFELLLAELQEAIAASTASKAHKDALYRLVSEASYYDYILGVMEADEKVKTRRIIVSYDGHYEDGIKGTYRLHTALGLGKRKFTFELPFAAESKSFHLQVEGPENMYAYEVFPLWGYSGRTSTEGVDASRGRIRNKLISRAPLRGDQHAHVYMRDLDGGPIIDLQSKDGSKVAQSIPRVFLEYREHPPGVLGPVLAVSLWLTVLTWTVGFFHDDIFRVQAGTTPGAQGWATVIFGVPAIVTGWILSKADAKTLRGISLATFGALSLLALDAVLLVSVSALKIAGVGALSFDLGFINVQHGTWTAMMLLTLFHLAVCFGMFLTRSIRYASTINERIE